MVTIHKIFPAGFASNSYLLTADGKNAVAVDPSQPRVLEEAARRGLTVSHVLLTHGHFDHIGGCAALQAAGARIGCLKEEASLALGPRNMGEAFGMPVPPFTVDFTFEEGETLGLCGIAFSVLATPGHTAGSACFLADGHLFSGDTLFFESVGRTDLPTGSARSLEHSVKRLYTLPDCPVHPGHGEDTTLAHERAYNPYITL